MSFKGYFEFIAGTPAFISERGGMLGQYGVSATFLAKIPTKLMILHIKLPPVYWHPDRLKDIGYVKIESGFDLSMMLSKRLDKSRESCQLNGDITSFAVFWIVSIYVILNWAQPQHAASILVYEIE